MEKNEKTDKTIFDQQQNEKTKTYLTFWLS